LVWLVTMAVSEFDVSDDAAAAAAAAVDVTLAAATVDEVVDDDGDGIKDQICVRVDMMIG